jgi:hypothetical protein
MHTSKKLSTPRDQNCERLRLSPQYLPSTILTYLRKIGEDGNSLSPHFFMFLSLFGRVTVFRECGVGFTATEINGVTYAPSTGALFDAPTTPYDWLGFQFVLPQSQIQELVDEGCLSDELPACPPADLAFPCEDKRCLALLGAGLDCRDKFVALSAGAMYSLAYMTYQECKVTFTRTTYKEIDWAPVEGSLDEPVAPAPPPPSPVPVAIVPAIEPPAPEPAPDVEIIPPLGPVPSPAPAPEQNVSIVTPLAPVPAPPPVVVLPSPPPPPPKSSAASAQKLAACVAGLFAVALLL